MVTYVARRLLATIPVLLMVIVVVFLILRLTPGDPAAIIAGDNANAEQLAAIRAQMGLDQPIYVQFATWAGHLLQGNFGISLISGKAVTELIGQRMWPSLALGTITIVLSVAIAIPLGIFAAWKQGKTADRLVMAGSVLGFSMPTFVIGYCLIWLFSVKLDWLPVQGYKPMADGLGQFVGHLVLPSLALSTAYIALIGRITRTSIVEVMGDDFIRTARAKGLREWSVLSRHALGNAAIPIITIIGVGIALLIGGVVITESVFNIPGVGRLVVESVLARDYPVIQGLILVFSFLYVLVNLAVDLTYMVFDPRIRY
ncbi:ABC transporter permease [Herbaspirillum chlorophenolicum]|uniref:ABC transporter permease n=1 Tax=Herbaspirillum chlorophenolicum TaxID=211589 RepID=UPI00067C8964|nr:ABC transporter permease [Herbaspirillum chlorophenolicum]